MWKFAAPFLLAASALAQNAAPPAFAVASVKINQQYNQSDPSTWQSSMQAKGDTLTVRNVTMRRLIAWSYDVQWPQLSGPAWIDSERYDIRAKAEKPMEEDEMRPMMRALLAERFHLQFHRETREVQVLALTLPKGGHKMTPSTKQKTDSHPDGQGGTMVEGVLISEMMENIAHETNNLPVVDMTGLAGRFDFHFNPAKYLATARDRARTERTSEAELKMGMMQELVAGEMGLKIESRKAPVEFLVIDQADQKPVEN